MIHQPHVTERCEAPGRSRGYRSTSRPRFSGRLLRALTRKDLILISVPGSAGPLNLWL